MGAASVTRVHRLVQYLKYTQRKNKKATSCDVAFQNSGSPTWTRTRDLRINSPSLYRLSYQGIDDSIICLQ